MRSLPAGQRKCGRLPNRFPRPSGNNLPGQQNPVLTILRIKTPAGLIEPLALPSIPEALYCIYVLNKIGAVANLIHPLAGKDETLHYINEVQSKIVVLFDGAYSTVSDEIGTTSAEHVIVASPANSLPMPLKIAYRLKVKKPKLDGRLLWSWKSFVHMGSGTKVEAMKKNCHEMAVISHTGGTTGEPKGCMLSDYNTNSVISQISSDLVYDRQCRLTSKACDFFIFGASFSLENGVPFFSPLGCGWAIEV